MLTKFCLLLLAIMSVAFESQKYVVVELKSKSVEVENDVAFVLLVSLKPANGIHVNVEPPISVKPLDESTKLNLKEVSMSGDYFDSSKPIIGECKVTRVAVGKHKISFIVNYTYCSDKEGWCRMGKDTVSATVNVKD